MPDPMPDPTPTPEQLQAMAAGFGRIAQRMVDTMAELLAPIAKRELAKAYGSQPPLWRPLARRIDPTYFGRKRRTRRARGRRIEARQPYSSAALAWRAVMAREAEPRRPLATFIDPSPGVQWGEITGDGSGEALPPIPDA